jgi:molybdopterin biosynthesis enzyme
LHFFLHFEFCILHFALPVVTDSKSHPARDVRMHGFSRRHTVEQALHWLDGQLRVLDAELIPLRVASGRVLASAIVSDLDVPGFDRATMDGYAVVADSTEGATPYNRIPLKVVGDALPGSPFTRTMARGEAVRIMTGAPIPAGADAVLPAESVDGGVERRLQPPRTREDIFAVSEVSPQKNIAARTSFAGRRCSRSAVSCDRRMSA